MASSEESSPNKWEGKAYAELPNTKAEQVWPLFEDFCNLHKWMPIDTCYQLEGTPGQPGLTRYCASILPGVVEGETTSRWAKEKLLAIDPIQRCFSYEVGDNNIGIKSYVATIKVLPIDENPSGCKIEWSFVSDPVEGWPFDAMFSYIQSSLHTIANRMELECSAAA